MIFIWILTQFILSNARELLALFSIFIPFAFQALPLGRWESCDKLLHSQAVPLLLAKRRSYKTKTTKRSLVAALCRDDRYVTVGGEPKCSPGKPRTSNAQSPQKQLSTRRFTSHYTCNKLISNNFITNKLVTS